MQRLGMHSKLPSMLAKQMQFLPASGWSLIRCIPITKAKILGTRVTFLLMSENFIKQSLRYNYNSASLKLLGT
ncbi:hypothetical protein H5410_024094 [Solanum commersonii]|uniref:Uncharacterized protein n=1 Tax=Solanum commersonii TaxID=4109 RepID=A0A9J5ZL01_SOLCO|nr:hypothetical protein H5410_024094 [Solanum commersonii]